MTSDAIRRLSPRRLAVLRVLCEVTGPLSTTEVRQRINRSRPQALVAEQVYRALLSLEQAGLARRVAVVGTRNVFWQAAVELTRDEVV